VPSGVKSTLTNKAKEELLLGCKAQYVVSDFPTLFTKSKTTGRHFKWQSWCIWEKLYMKKLIELVDGYKLKP